MSMRDEFEEWFEANHVRGGETVNLQMKADMWAGWQAAREQGAEPVAEIIAIGGQGKKWVSHVWLNVSSLDVGDKLYTHPHSAGVPEAFILRKQAEAVVSAIMVTGREFGRGDLTHSALRMFAEDYVQRLRKQADELEKNND